MTGHRDDLRPGLRDLEHRTRQAWKPRRVETGLDGDNDDDDDDDDDDEDDDDDDAKDDDNKVSNNDVNDNVADKIPKNCEKQFGQNLCDPSVLARAGNARACRRCGPTLEGCARQQKKKLPLVQNRTS